MAGKRKTPKRRAVTTAAPVLDDLPELREARALWVRNDLFGALAKFERAARDHPRHVRALADASRAYGAMYDFRRAEEMLERLVGLGRNNGHILHLAGQSYRLLRRPEAAMRCFREALAGRSPTSDSHLELGLLLERLNRLDEALDQAESRLRAQPKDPEGTFLKARIERRQGKFESASLALQSVTNTGSAHWLTRARAHAELAALFDERGAYAEAWEAMLAGKRVLAPYSKSAREHRDRIVPALLKLTETVTREQLAAWSEGPASESPRLALLTGLPRSGTTLLERILDAHPAIAAGDELDAFPRFMYPALLGNTLPQDISIAQLDRLSQTDLAKRRQWYAQALANALGRPVEEAWLLDKNPSLLPLVVPYLRLAPRSRVIVMLRDPRDVLVSCLMAYLPLNDFSVDFLSLETATDRVTADLAAWCSLRQQVGENVREVWYEDLVDDLQSVGQGVLEHLGLSWHEEVDRYRELGASRPVFSPSYDAVAQPIHRRAIGRWRNYEAQLADALPRLTNTLERLRSPQATAH